jgi:hypothetical protein
MGFNYIRMRVWLFISYFAFFGFATTVPAMDRWLALSMLESGDNDSATGPRGEISRFQIRRELWPGGNPRDTKTALAVAREIMRLRLDCFQQAHKRVASDFEFYVLWNAPSQVNHPCGSVAERAVRFANLVQSNDHQPQMANSAGSDTKVP